MAPFQHQDRRMSIESLISSGSYAASSGENGFQVHANLHYQTPTPKAYYGVDPGYPDFDIHFNHDLDALNDVNPSINATPMNVSKDGARLEQTNSQFTNGVPHKAFYKTPIIVNIPEEFEPLPPVLKLDPMNLLYFHHFISHTAKILVPHDCSGNPFRKILPKSEAPLNFAG